MRRRGLAWTGLLLAVLNLLAGTTRAQDPFSGQPQPWDVPNLSQWLRERDEGLPPRLYRGQDATGYALPDTFVPSPLASTREEGPYFFGAFAMYIQTLT